MYTLYFIKIIYFLKVLNVIILYFKFASYLFFFIIAYNFILMLSDNESYHSDSVSISSDESFISLANALGDFLRQTFGYPYPTRSNIPSHYSDLLEDFTDSEVHAILISKSWFKPHLPSASYSLPGFVLIRKDRIDRRGGGISIYLRCSISYEILTSSPCSCLASAKYLFLEVITNGAKVILGVIYCKVYYFSSLEPILESLGFEYAHHIIMSNFITDLLASCSLRSHKILQVIESSSLHVLPLSATHHNINGSDT